MYRMDEKIIEYRNRIRKDVIDYCVALQVMRLDKEKYIALLTVLEDARNQYKFSLFLWAKREKWIEDHLSITFKNEIW